MNSSWRGRRLFVPMLLASFCASAFGEQKQRELPSDKTPEGKAQKAAYENAASNELKAAMNQFNVGRKAEAIKKFKQIVSHYPGSEVASQAQEKLDELEPENKDR